MNDRTLRDHDEEMLIRLYRCLREQDRNSVLSEAILRAVGGSGAYDATRFLPYDPKEDREYDLSSASWVLTTFNGLLGHTAEEYGTIGAGVFGLIDIGSSDTINRILHEAQSVASKAGLGELWFGEDELSQYLWDARWKLIELCEHRSEPADQGEQEAKRGEEG